MIVRIRQRVAQLLFYDVIAIWLQLIVLMMVHAILALRFARGRSCVD